MTSAQGVMQAPRSDVPNYNRHRACLLYLPELQLQYAQRQDSVQNRQRDHDSKKPPRAQVPEAHNFEKLFACLSKAPARCDRFRGTIQSETHELVRRHYPRRVFSDRAPCEDIQPLGHGDGDDATYLTTPVILAPNQSKKKSDIASQGSNRKREDQITRLVLLRRGCRMD
jgi:hypothetical protein